MFSCFVKILINNTKELKLVQTILFTLSNSSPFDCLFSPYHYLFVVVFHWLLYFFTNFRLYPFDPEYIILFYSILISCRGNNIFLRGQNIFDPLFCHFNNYWSKRKSFKVNFFYWWLGGEYRLFRVYSQLWKCCFRFLKMINWSFLDDISLQDLKHYDHLYSSVLLASQTCQQSLWRYQHSHK